MEAPHNHLLSLCPKPGLQDLIPLGHRATPNTQTQTLELIVKLTKSESLLLAKACFFFCNATYWIREE